MTSVGSALSALQVGSQLPRLSSCPPFTSSAGQEAVELAASAGVILDEWECSVLHGALGEKPGGGWAAFEVGLVVPRQNGKGEVILARELFGLFLLESRLQVHTAHEFKTAADAFRRIMQVIESTPDLDSRVAKVNRAHGDEGVTLRSGATLRFFARTGGSGRGFSGDTVYLDEAYNIPEAATAALLPTMATRPDPQLWYASSAVDQVQHANGLVLARVRRRALAGGDTSLAYFEWSADESLYRGRDGDVDLERAGQDPQAWVVANPSLDLPRPFALSSAHVERERSAMTARSFAVERLGIGDWPTDGVAGVQVIPAEQWAGLVDRTSRMTNPVVFAVDVSPGDRPRASIGVAGRLPSGRPSIEIADNRTGTDWVVARLIELVQRHDPAAVVIDGRSPAAALIPSLAQQDIEVTTISTAEMAAACGLFYADATQDGLVHRDDPRLTEALTAARRRPLGDAWAWNRKATSDDITPLVAVTLARYGLEAHARPRPAAPAPIAVSGSTPSKTGNSQLMTAGF